MLLLNITTFQAQKLNWVNGDGKFLATNEWKNICTIIENLFRF